MKPSVLWSSRSIESEKAEIRAWVETLPKEAKGRMQALLKEVRHISKESGPRVPLRHFLLIVFTLAHHLRTGLLSEKEVHSLGYMGDALLRIQGVEPGKSRVAFLFGDLHLMLSQIFWKSGRQWDAAWEQFLATTQGGTSPQSGAGTPFLAMANRAFRLGQTGTALDWLTEADSLGLDAGLSAQADLKRLMIHRLRRDFPAAEALSGELSARPGLSNDEKREIEWERLCRGAESGEDIGELLNSVRRGKSHHEAEYAMEAFLWSRAVAPKRWIEQYPTFRKLVYSSAIEPKSKDPLFAAVQSIEACYDASVSLGRRLRDLGEALSQVSKLVNVGHEVLVWAAALRWVTRVNLKQARRLVEEEYASLSRKLTGGKHADALGLFSSAASKAEAA